MILLNSYYLKKIKNYFKEEYFCFFFKKVKIKINKEINDIKLLIDFS